MNKKRLLKLAKHLESGKRGAKRFDFSTYSRGAPTKKHPCGTMACAMGEMPAAFPRQFCMIANLPQYRNGSIYARTDVADFFNISDDLLEYLFYPGKPCPLGEKATAKQVAKHIRKFVEKGGIY